MGAKILDIIFSSDYQVNGLLLQMLSINFLAGFLIQCINIEPQIETIESDIYRPDQD